MKKEIENVDEIRRKLAIWTVPVVMSVVLPAHAQTSWVEPECVDCDPDDPPNDPPSDDCVEDCDPDDPPNDPPVCDGEWKKSSFVFTSDYVFCNHGDGPSVCNIRYTINIDDNLTGRPEYLFYASGVLPPLGEDGCHDMESLMPSGNYRYEIIVYQDEGHPGTGQLASRGSR